MPARSVRLLLRRHLLIGIAPSANLQSAAYPTQIVRGLRTGKRRANCATYRTPLGSSRPFGMHRLFRHVQNLRRDDWLGDGFLFHSCLHYKTHRLRDWPTNFRNCRPEYQSFPWQCLGRKPAVEIPRTDPSRCLVPPYDMPCVEERMTSRTLLARLHNQSFATPDHLSLHSVRADRTISQVCPWRRLCFRSIYLEHRSTSALSRSSTATPFR